MYYISVSIFYLRDTDELRIFPEVTELIGGSVRIWT